MAVELAAAYVQIIPSTRGLAGKMRQEVGGPLESIVAGAGEAGGRGFAANLVSSSVAGLDRLGGRIVSTVTTGAKIAAAAGGAIIAAGLAGGLKRVLDTEDATIAFQQMGLGVAEIDRVLAGVDKTFDGTPFANPDGFNIAAQLLASGRSLTDVEDDLRNIANVTSQTLDKDLNRTSDTFLRIAATGRVYARDLNSLAMQGIPIRNILAEALDVSVDSLNDMVSAGEVTFDMMMDAIGATERFDGAAQAMGSSTRGAFANVLTGVSRLGESFLGPLFGENGYAVQALQAIRGALRDMTPVADELGQKFADWLIPAISDLADWFSNDLVPALQDGMAWFDRNREMIGKLSAAILPAVAVVGALATAVNLIAVAFKILGLSTPVGWIMAIVAGLIYAWQNSETFRNIVLGVWEAIVTAVGPAVEMIGGWLDSMAERFNLSGEGMARFGEAITLAWQRILEVVQPIIEWFVTHVGPVIQAAAEFAIEWWGLVAEAFSHLMEQIRAAWDLVGEPTMQIIEGAWEQLKTAAEFAWNAILIVIETALAIIASVIELATALIRGDWEGVWNAISDIASIIWEGIQQTVANSLAFVLETMQNILTTVLAMWGEMWEDIRATVAETWESIKETVSTKIDEMMLFFVELPGRIREAFAEAGTWLLEAGKSIIQGLIDGISQKAEEIAEPVRRVASRIRGFFPASPAEEGPLSGRGHTLYAGQIFAEDMAAGITSRIPTVEAAAADLAAAARMEASAVIPDLLGQQRHGGFPSARLGPAAPVRDVTLNAYGNADYQVVFRARHLLREEMGMV